MRIGQEWIYDFVMNVFLFIPSGFLLARFFSYKLSRRPAVFFYVCLVCAAISLSIELVQIIIPVRYPSVYDVFANVLGAGIGACLNVALSIIRILK
jgi:glycopeptide antibiotics resistance protein